MCTDVWKWTRSSVPGQVATRPRSAGLRPSPRRWPSPSIWYSLKHSTASSWRLRLEVPNVLLLIHNQKITVPGVGERKAVVDEAFGKTTLRLFGWWEHNISTGHGIQWRRSKPREHRSRGYGYRATPCQEFPAASFMDRHQVTWPRKRREKRRRRRDKMSNEKNERTNEGLCGLTSYHCLLWWRRFD